MAIRLEPAAETGELHILILKPDTHSGSGEVAEILRAALTDSLIRVAL